MIARAAAVLGSEASPTSRQKDDREENRLQDESGRRPAEKEDAMSDFSDTLNDAAKDGYEAARSGVKEARRTVGARARQLRQGYSGVQENLAHASDDFGDFVRHNPGRAVLFAAGFGFLIGLILRGFRD